MQQALGLFQFTHMSPDIHAAKTQPRPHAEHSVRGLVSRRPELRG